METIVIQQAGLGFFGWLIVFAILGAIPLIFKKQKKDDSKPEEKK